MFSSVSLNKVCFYSLYMLAVASLKSYLLNPHLSPLSQLLLPALCFIPGYGSHIPVSHIFC